MKKYNFVFAILVFAFVACSTPPVKRQASQLPYTSGQLKLIEVDEMSEMAAKKVDIFKKTGDTKTLDEAIILVLARPDSDNIAERLLLNIRNSLESGRVWENTISRVIDRSVESLNDKSTSVEDEIAYTIVLQNLLSEMRVEFNKTDVSTRFEQSMIERLAATDIEITDKASREAKLSAMTSLVSPSEIAKKLLKDIPALLKSKK